MRVVRAVSIAGFAIALGFVLLSFTPYGWKVPQAALPIFILVTFCCLGPGIYAGSRLVSSDGGWSMRLGASDLIRIRTLYLPRFGNNAGRAQVAIAAVFVSIWAIGMFSMFDGASGVPQIEDGGYFLNNHGDFTPLTESEYHDELASDLRSFACVMAMMLTFATLLADLFVWTSNSASGDRLATEHRPQA